MSKEFTVTLTGLQRWDLWHFFFQHGGYKPRDREQARNLDAVCEAFKLTEIQARFDELAEAGEGKLGPKDFAEVACPVGSVDLKRMLEYLDKLPETLPTALSLRLLKVSDLLSDVKEGKRHLTEVPDVKEGA